MSGGAITDYLLFGQGRATVLSPVYTIMEIKQLSYWSFDPQEHKKKSPLWQGYEPIMDDGEALRDFEKRYGYKAEKILRYDRSCLLVGPVIEE